MNFPSICHIMRMLLTNLIKTNIYCTMQLNAMHIVECDKTWYAYK